MTHPVIDPRDELSDVVNSSHRQGRLRFRIYDHLSPRTGMNFVLCTAVVFSVCRFASGSMVLGYSLGIQKQSIKRTTTGGQSGNDPYETANNSSHIGAYHYTARQVGTTSVPSGGLFHGVKTWHTLLHQNSGCTRK